MRFADARFTMSLTHAVLLAVCVVSVAGCGASAPQQASRDERGRITPSQRTEAAQSEQASPQSEQKSAPKEARTPATDSFDRTERRERRRERGTRTTAPQETADDGPAPIPADVQASFEHALAAVRAENWVQAELELEQLTETQPAYPGPLVNLAIVYLHDGRTADARKALESALQIDPGFPAANDELGVLLRQSGDFAGAERAYRKALEQDPGYSLAHYNLGVLLDVYLRRPEEALEQYELYQSSVSTPDQTVGRWIVDLRRRTGNKQNVSGVAQEDGT